MNKIIFRQMLPIRTLLHLLFRRHDSNPTTFWMYRIQTFDKRIPSFCRLGPILFLFKYISGCDPKNLECPELVLSVQSDAYYLQASPSLRVKGNTPNQQYRTNQTYSG